MSWLFLVVAIATEVAATLMLRASEGFRRRRWIAPIVVLYLVSFAALSLALDRGLGLGLAYGIWTAAGVAATAVLSRVIFREPLTPLMAAGIGLIAAGVLVVELGAHAG